MTFIRKHKLIGAMILIASYITGVAISVFVIGILPLLNTKPTEQRHARTIWEETTSGEIISSGPWRNQYSRILIYDSNDALIYYSINEPGKTPADLEDYISGWRERVLSGYDTFNITSDQFRGSLLNFWLTSGTAIYEYGKVTGVVFLIRDIQIVQNSIIYFLILYSVGFWVCMTLMLRYSAKKEKLEQLQKNYVANITHQLKTPIATINALTESLCDGMVDQPDKQQLYYGRILKETQNQAHMISENLELARIQSDDKYISKSFVTAEDLFRKIVDKYSMLCEYSGLEFEVDEKIWQLPSMYTDKRAVGQILETILDNSLKYVQDGGTVRLTCMNENPVKIVISDNGPGIKPEDIDHLFERFYRCRDTEDVDGSGLGLAIASETAKKLKEKLYVKSVYGKGTDFYLTIHRK